MRQAACLLLLCLLPGRVFAAPGSCPQYDPGLLVPSPDGKLVVTADNVTGKRGDLATLEGHVQVRDGLREFDSTTLHYDDARQVLLADTPSLFRNENYVVLSQSARYDLNGKDGRFEEAEFTLLQRGARGTARTMQVDAGNNARLDHMSYTSCAPGNNAWRLDAGRVQLDQQRGIGTAHNAVLRLADVPVLYLPYVQFPIDGERHTGLLFPTIGNTTRTGFDARWPVYLNLAPNYDATLIPREMSDRGVQIGATGRYLFERSAGRATFEYMPNDQAFGGSRSFTEWYHDSLINQRLSTSVHYAEVSDPRYFEDLSYQPGLAALPYLERSAKLVYQAPASYSVQALVQKFQLLANSQAVDDPYQRLPEICLDAHTQNDFYGVRGLLFAQATNFAKENAVHGVREVVVPSVQWAQDTGGQFTTLQGDFSATRYQLSDVNDEQLNARQRTLPVVSADAGLRFQRENANGDLGLLEPRLFYLYVPYRNQDGLPVFDAGVPDYDFPRLFARNRYVGYDRIADANQLTTAATYRDIDSGTGSTRYAISAGQIYRFTPSEVTLPGQSVQDGGSSDYLVGGEWRINHRLSATSLVEWSPDNGRFSRTSASLRYRGPTVRADFDYRYRAGLLEQIDTSASAPVSASFRLAARMRYSLRDERILDSLFGVDYETCCYALRSAYRRFIANSLGQVDSGIFFQLELKGLSNIGTSLTQMLPRDSHPLGDN